MKTRHFSNTLCKQKVKTFFLNTLIVLNVKWVPRFCFNNPFVKAVYKEIINFYFCLLSWSIIILNNVFQETRSLPVITNIRDGWKEECRRMKDKSRWVKTKERPMQASKDESKTNDRRVQTSVDEWEMTADECKRIRDECYSIIHESRVYYCFYFEKNM